MTIQTPVERIDSVDTLEGFINDTCSGKSSYLDYVPSLSTLSTCLNNKLQEIRKIAERNENLRELSVKVSSCIEQLCLFQKEAVTSEKQAQVIKTLSSTLANFKEELDTPSTDTNLEDEFELVFVDDGQREKEPDDPQLQQSMLYTLYDGVWDASRTASLKMFNYMWGQDITDVIERPENIPQEYLYTIRSLIENIGGRLTTREVVDFINALSCSEVYAEHADFLGTALCNKHSIDNRRPSELINSFLNLRIVKDCIEIKGTPPVDLVFIPFVFKGSELLEMIPYVDTGHVVLITVCFSKKTIEYYDSFAYAPETWTCYEGFCMKEELESIKTLCFGDEDGEVLFSTTKQQHDWHSCGVFVIWYIIQRLNDISFEEIASKEVTATDIEWVRTELAKTLASPRKINKKITLDLSTK